MACSSFATGSVGIAQAAEAERPVSGLVSRAQPHAGILHLGSMRFYVPDDVYDLDELSEGDQATSTPATTPLRRRSRPATTTWAAV